MTAKEIYIFIAKHGCVSENVLAQNTIVRYPGIETQKALEYLIHDGYVVKRNGLYAISGKKFE